MHHKIIYIPFQNYNPFNLNILEHKGVKKVQKQVLLILIMLIFIFTFCGAVSAAEWNVNPGQSIQSVINNNATNGDTITVNDPTGNGSTYKENLVINKNLTIKTSGNVTLNLEEIDGDAFFVSASGSGSTIKNFNIKGAFNGVYLNSANNCVISGNYIYNCLYGIYSSESSNNQLINNTLNNITYDWAINIYNGQNNTIRDNKISNSFKGMEISYSPGNILRNNQLTNNIWNFGINGNDISNFVEDIDTSNTVNGKPIYYYYNDTTGLNIDDSWNPGYVGLVQCTGVTVNGISISNNINGILLAGTNNSTIQNCNFNNNMMGVYLSNSQYNEIKWNNLDGNDMGIRMWYSPNNKIDSNNIINTTGLNDGIITISSSNNNTLSNNTFKNSNNNGIELYSSSNNILFGNMVEDISFTALVLSGSSLNRIFGNTIKNSQNGIKLYFSPNNNNNIYNNNFINNTVQVSVQSGTGNTFNRSEPIGGNYWSDYTGNDSNGDGFGDIPYGNDYLPYVNPILNVFYGESIQNAVNIAQANYNIIVHDNNGIECIYSENIILDKGLRLKSIGNVILQALNSNLPVITITQNGNGSNIERFTIKSGFNCSIYSENSFNNTISNNAINGDLGSSKSLWGMCLINNRQIKIINNTIINCEEGINLYNSYNNTMVNNTVRNNHWDNIALNYSVLNIISGNNITNADSGIRLIGGSNNNTISNNNLTANIWTSISLVDSQFNQILENQLNNNQEGMYIYASNNNTISNNTANNNIWDGIAIHDSNNNTVTEQTNVTGNSCGVRIIGSSSSNEIMNNIIDDNSWSNISIETATNTIIHNNTLSNANVGIYLQGSSNNQIYNNTIQNNLWDGIDLLDGSNNNTVYDNTLSGSYYGERILDSNSNISYRNNFINNTVQAYDNGSNNWDYITTGNYWSDWSTTDPRSIDGGFGIDNYPSVNQF